MIRTTILIYLVLLILSLVTLKILFREGLTKRNASLRRKVVFVRRSRALLLVFHLFYVCAAVLVWGIRTALG